MKIKITFVAPLLALLAFATPALADTDNPPPTSNSQNGNAGIPNPEGQPGHEHGEFEHHVKESNENGFEIVQFLLIGGALVVAVLLAYNAGKRNRKKKEQN